MSLQFCLHRPLIMLPSSASGLQSRPGYTKEPKQFRIHNTRAANITFSHFSGFICIGFWKTWKTLNRLTGFPKTFSTTLRALESRLKTLFLFVQTAFRIRFH